MAIRAPDGANKFKSIIKPRANAITRPIEIERTKNLWRLGRGSMQRPFDAQISEACAVVPLCCLMMVTERAIGIPGMPGVYKPTRKPQ